MPSDFVVKHQMLEELAHGLMQMKTQARSIVNAAEAYLPIANENAAAELKDMIDCGQKIELRAKLLYDRNVKAAFGEQPVA